MSLGQLIVKTIILSYNEAQGGSKSQQSLALLQPLSQYLLTF
jgi:hypothetical protein